MHGLQGVQGLQLQREAGQRLNALMDEIRNSPKANMSAKNLGNEGATYVVEALAFNSTCAASPGSATCKAELFPFCDLFVSSFLPLKRRACPGKSSVHARHI